MPPVETTRPMNEEERALLRAPFPTLFGWWTGILSAVCSFALTFFVVLLAAGFLPYAAVLGGAVAGAMLVSVAVYLGIQRRERMKLRHMADLVTREDEAGYVNSTVYAITDAVAVEELEDEGLHYYLLLDDGRTLFLSGQYLYGPAEKGFPWASFEVVRAAQGGWVLRMAPRGASLTPSWTRGPFSDDECNSGGVPEDGAIEPRDFESLKQASTRR